MSQGMGNIIISNPPGGGAGGIVVTGADNGLSVTAAGKIVLGQDVGQVGAPAKLLSSREIPLQGLSVLLSGQGATAAGNLPGLTFQQDATILGNTPQMTVTDSTGGELGRITFQGNVTDDGGSVYIGRLAGASDTPAAGASNSNVGIGWRCLGVNTTGFANTFAGYESGWKLTTGDQDTGIGANSLINLTTGSDNACCGYNSGFQLVTGTKNACLGSHAGEGLYLGSTENVCVGYFAGDFSGNGAVGSTGNVCIGSQTFFSAALQGNFNIAIGYHCLSLPTQCGDHNIFIGDSVVVSGGAPTNTTVLGHGITCNISNVAVIGRADQNVIIGSTASPTNTGQKLQVLGNALINGNLQTANPGAGAGLWELGVVVTAAITENLTQYIQISIGGTTYKLVTAN